MRKLLAAPSPAIAEEVNLYAPYGSHQEPLEAYEDAVAANDVEKQEEILAIGRASLDSSISEGDSIISMLPMTRTTPDDAYWIAQFPTYFSSGGWINRQGLVSLSLYPKNPITWTSAKAAYAWYSTMARFDEDYRWANTNVMKEQFYCHWTLGSWKSPWNLEPSKTSINPVTCN